MKEKKLQFAGADIDNQHLCDAVEEITQKLNERNQELEILVENIPGGVHRCKNDAALTLISMSGGFFSMFGYTREDITELFHDSFIEMIYEGDRETVEDIMAEQLSEGCTVEFEYRVRCKSGELIWILDKGRLVLAEDGSETFFCVMIDITQSKEDRERTRLMLERHNVIMNLATDIIFEWDIQRDTLELSANWEKKFGYPPITQDVGKNLQQLNIHPEDLPTVRKLMKETTTGTPCAEAEFRIRKNSKEYVWCRVRVTTQLDNQERPTRAVGVIADINDEKKRMQQLVEQARRDSLTGLYNKAAIDAMVEERLDGYWGSSALMIIDLDDFKVINDTYGHPYGDLVLSKMGETLLRMFDSSDLLGRIGGDEFLVLLSNIGSRKLVEQKVQAVIDELGQIVPEQGGVPISCCIGVMYMPEGGEDYYRIYKCADRALYHAKGEGKGRYAFYDQDLCGFCLPSGLAHSAILETIDASKVTNVDEELTQYVFRLLYDAVDTQTAVNQILQVVGRAYDVSRAYVFEVSPDGLFCSNTFEWCNDGVTPEKDNLQNLSFEKDLPGFFNCFDENDMFYCQNIETLNPTLQEVLKPQGVVSLLQSFIRDNGVFRGYVGFDECRDNRYWTQEQIYSLTLISNMLSTFLIKHRLKEQLEELQKDRG